LESLTTEAGNLSIEEGVLKSRISTGEARQKELTQRILGLETTVQDLEQAKKADMAVHLAATLIPGEPCPVCGSGTHPHPALPGAAVSGMDQDLESLAHALKNAERDAAIQETTLKTQSQELGKVQHQLAVLRQTAIQIREASQGDPALTECFPSELPSAQAVSQLLKTTHTLLEDLTRRRNEARKAGALIPGLYEALRELEGALGKTEQDHAVIAEKHRGLRLAIEDIQEKHRLVLEERGFGRDTSGKPVWVRAQEALQVLEQGIKEREQRITAYRDAREQAGRDLAGAEAQETAARINRNEAARKYQDAVVALEAALAASPFAAREDLKAAILHPDQAEALETAITRWREEGARLTSLLAELKTSLEQIRVEAAAFGSTGEADPGIVRGKLEDLAKAQEQAELQRDQAQGKLLNLERDVALLKEAAAHHETLAKESGRLNALSADLAGKNPKKRSFDAWLLGLYLAEVASFATKRLERMSESRYSLILDMQRETGRALTGLDLAVFDGYTGKTRPCATLSGGESFMASISLALGLADSIQARSGGIRLDAVFIDEGFGSLDEGSLDKALVILDELRDHRMVGLISHVGELCSRIPCRIEVIKSVSGSFLKI
jgi:exonuclease SbcC